MPRPPGHNFHPARISGRQKFLRNLDIQREAEKNKKKHGFEPLDLSKPDWSKKKRA